MTEAQVVQYVIPTAVSVAATLLTNGLVVPFFNERTRAKDRENERRKAQLDALKSLYAEKINACAVISSAAQELVAVTQNVEKARTAENPGDYTEALAAHGIARQKMHAVSEEHLWLMGFGVCYKGLELVEQSQVDILQDETDRTMHLVSYELNMALRVAMHSDTFDDLLLEKAAKEKWLAQNKKMSEAAILRAEKMPPQQ